MCPGWMFPQSPLSRRVQASRTSYRQRALPGTHVVFVVTFPRKSRAALFAVRIPVDEGVGVTVDDKWGVSDPLCHPPVEVLLR